MNTNVASKLNNLLRRSTPIYVGRSQSGGGLPTAFRHDQIPIMNKLEEVIAQALRRHKDEAIRLEVVDAALNRRPAETTVPYSWRNTTEYNAGKFAATLAWPEIEAYIKQDDAERLAEYEAYRILCEQSAAVPLPLSDE